MSECKHGQGKCLGIHYCSVAYPDCDEQPKERSVQSVEELVAKIIKRVREYENAKESVVPPDVDLRIWIESDRAAQRQAGRKEAQEELENIKHLAEMRGNGWSKARKELLGLAKSYAVLVEAAKTVSLDLDGFGMVFVKDRIDLNKALSDIDALKGATHE